MLIMYHINMFLLIFLVTNPMYQLLNNERTIMMEWSMFEPDHDI